MIQTLVSFPGWYLNSYVYISQYTYIATHATKLDGDSKGFVCACLTLCILFRLRPSVEMMEHILCTQDLEMGSADGGGSKLHPADRISGRRSGGQLAPKRLRLVGRDA